MIVKDQIENAVAILRRDPDGSNANKQARENARNVLREAIKVLKAFRDKDPNNVTVVSHLNAKIGDYNAMT